jgi:hypothetical protein
VTGSEKILIGNGFLQRMDCIEGSKEVGSTIDLLYDAKDYQLSLNREYHGFIPMSIAILLSIATGGNL